MDNRLLKTTNDEGGTLTAQLASTETSTAHVTPVPDKAPGLITAEPGTAKEEAIYYKSKDALAGTISGLTRDYTNLNGGVGQQHENGEDWESLQAAEYPNNLVDALMEGFFLEHQTSTYVSTSSFTVEGNQTPYYTIGRIIRLNGSIICTVVSSSYSSPNTTVTVNETTIPNPITSVELEIVPKAASNIRMPAIDEDDMASNSATKVPTQQSAKAYADLHGIGIYRQALINPNCQVCQAVTAVNLTNGKLFGNVDMFYAKGEGTAVSAGTIAQATAANVGNSGYALKLAGVTLTGTGIVNAYTFIESRNAKLYKNKTASFSVKVYHDVGSAKNYTIRISKANSADNFSATTEISVSSAQSVPNTTETLIKLENVSLGDCSNGIEIQVFCECGAITTKNFEFTDWQFNAGAVVLPFQVKTFAEELRSCQTYYEKSYNYTTAPGTVDSIEFFSFLEGNDVSHTVIQSVMFKATKRTNAYTVNLYDRAGAINKFSSVNAALSLVTNGIAQGVINKNSDFFTATCAITAHAGSFFHYVAIDRPTIA